MDTTQLILIAGILIMAGTNTVSLIWGFYANEKSHKKPAPKIYNVNVDGSQVFPEIDLKKVEELSRQQLLQVIGESTAKLEQSVNLTIDGLRRRIEGVIGTSLTQESEKFQVNLQTLRDQSVSEFGKLQAEINTHRTKLLAELSKEVGEAQKKQMEVFSKELDTRLNDIISSYLVESLGNSVDLGAQATYIFDALEGHKEDIKRDLQS